MKPGSRDIAIIGMACVYPGAKDVRSYWENILAKVDAVSDPPPDWEADFYYDPDSRDNDRTYCKRGGFLGSLATFDPARYGVMPNVVDGAEPDHFLSLRAAYDALSDAGYLHKPEWRERTEVIIGRGTYVNRGNTNSLQHVVVVDAVIRVLRQLHPDYSDQQLAEIKEQLKASLPPFHADIAAGLVPNVITGRIANRLDLMGANYIVDAACASSLVAVDHGVRDLQSGRCDLAVVGGVNASVPPVIVAIFSQIQALSKSSRIRPFDAEADGTLLGEGVGMLVLKRVADAEADGDRIYALIKGVGIASDGRATGLLAPRLEGEELALRRAYEDAQVDPATVGLIEAHGTGTPLGDSVEIKALRNVMGERRSETPRCALGSVKSMISHTMPAAGAAGIIKAALALHHKVLPPTLHCENPDPKLGLESSNLYVNSETRPWIHGSSTSPRRAGVNAFGFGGINAHTVLEEYTGPNQAPWLQHRWDSELFVVSAAREEELRREITAFRDQVSGLDPAVELRDIAWDRNCRHPRESCRLAVVATSREDLVRKLDQALAKLPDPKTARLRMKEGIYYFREPLARSNGKLAVVFPGEGAQYPQMLADLCIHFPEARHWLDLMDRAFENHTRHYRLSDFIYPLASGADESRLWSMDIGAEAVFSANMAVWAVLENLGIRPDAMAGHSTGEHSALLAARVVRTATEEDLIRHILGVNRVFERWSSAGRIPNGVLMAVAGADRSLLDRLIEQHRDSVFVALDNCPHQVVLFGSDSVVESMKRALDGGSAICQELPFDRAYHTPWFQTFAESVLEHFRQVAIAPAEIALYSCVTAAPFPSDPDQIRDLAAVHWARTVRFRETIEAMYESGVRIFVEAGPRGNLTSFIDDILRGRPYAALPADSQHRPSIVQLHHLLGQLAAHGVELRLDHLYSRRAPTPPEDYKEPRPKREKVLAMGLQPLRLPTGYAVNPEPGRAPQPPAPVPETRSPAIATPPPAAAAAPARSRDMERHRETMQRFHPTQQQGMGAYLTTRGRPGAGTARTKSGRPFLTEILEHEHGVRVRARHRLSPVRDVFLEDHTLGRDIAEFDASLMALPVVPFTVTMEIMAQAASLVLPGKVVTCMQEVRGSRWISLESGETAIEVTAERTGQAGDVHVRVYAAEGEGLRPLWAECVVSLADRYPEAPKPADPRYREPRKSAWTSQRLYTEGMFHGPRFRAVSSMDLAAADGTVATLQVLPREALTAAGGSQYLTDPIVLDAAGQVVAFWSQEVLLPEGDIFPYRLERLECYRPPQPAGTRLECRVYVRHVDEMVIHSDIEICDASGNLHYRLKSWEDRRFRLPTALWRLRIQPRATLLSEPWNDVLRPEFRERGVVCRRLTEIPRGLLEMSHGIWLEMLAALILSRRERDYWRAMAATDKRRIDWLLGRAAAKDAVRILAKQLRGAEACAADVEILAGPEGRPVVSEATIARLGIDAQVSIAHSGSYWLALASPSGADLVGVDVESMDRDVDAIQAVAFGEQERELLGGLAGADRFEWAIRLWCAKEAAAKALGRGLSRGLESVRGAAIRPEEGLIEIEIGGALQSDFPELAGKRLLASTIRENGVVGSALVWERRGL